MKRRKAKAGRGTKVPLEEEKTGMYQTVALASVWCAVCACVCVCMHLCTHVLAGNVLSSVVC